MLVEEFLSRSTSRNSKKKKRKRAQIKNKKNTDRVLLLHLKSQRIKTKLFLLLEEKKKRYQS